ncbi:MAG: hypothetical protein AAF928_03960 [Myxococcota bacterium]
MASLLRARFVFPSLSVILAAAACGDAELALQPPSETGGGDATSTTSTGIGPVGGSCPTARCGASRACCAEGEECVNDFQCLPSCAAERCGDNGTICCNPGEVCLNGQDCAADCPPDQALCGAAFDVCCPTGDVCLNAGCVTPGSSCADDFDCPDDTFYCEETLGVCLPVPSGPLCEGEPQFNPIAPLEEWYWPGITFEGKVYENTIAAPTVGDVDGDGTPEVVTVMYTGSDLNDAIIVVLDGEGDGMGNGQVLFTIPSAADASAPPPFFSSAVALANFDADPGLELVYNLEGGGIRIADNDGVGDLGVRTSGPADTTIRGGPNVVDINDDGTPDVVIRCHALDGTDISNAALDLLNVSGCGENTVVADLDQDGIEEVIDATNAISATGGTGTVLWQTTGITSGFLAVADVLPAIAGPEVINIRNGLFIIDGQTGAVLVGPGGSVLDQSIAIPGAGNGGAPTVADFDADGLPEISTAGQAAYVVYDPDCADPPLRMGGQCSSGRTDVTLWSTPTQDLSSSRTGSSVFDFQGDGAAEVLYNDECFFHIYDGTTGGELLSPVLANSSRTDAEYPLVADVDGDGNAEVVVIGNADQAIGRDNCDFAWKQAGVSIDELCQITNCTAAGACDGNGSCDFRDTATDFYMCDANNVCQRPGGTRGVRVYGDTFDSWVRTRPVWNQFHYHVTNITFDAGFFDVPVNEAANWLSFNNYRQNVQGGVLFPVPNLQIDLTATPLCPNAIKLAAVVTNVGSSGAPAGIEIAFARVDVGPTVLGTVTTQTVILPGGSETLTFDFLNPPDDVNLVFEATTDPADLVEECDDEDNTATDSASCARVPR